MGLSKPSVTIRRVFGAILLGMLYWSGMPYEWAFVILATLVTGLLAYLYQFGCMLSMMSLQALFSWFVFQMIWSGLFRCFIVVICIMGKVWQIDAVLGILLQYCDMIPFTSLDSITLPMDLTSSSSPPRGNNG